MRLFICSVVLVSLFLAPTTAGAEQILVTVKGMVCTFCAQGIKKNFSRNENVKGIEVDMDKKLVSITTKEEGVLSDDEVRGIIVDAGYDVLRIERAKDAAVAK